MATSYVRPLLIAPNVLPALLAGSEKVYFSVSETMGPLGRNCVFFTPDGKVLTTRDGVTVARQIYLENIFEQMGVEMVRGASEEQVNLCGDGTTLAVVLTHNIFAEGLKVLAVDANPVAIKRGILAASAAVVDEVKSKTTVIPTDKDGKSDRKTLAQVATISANNDPIMGDYIASAMITAGKDGVVVVEQTSEPKSRIEQVTGCQFNSGWLAPEFVTDEARKECVLEDVMVLIVEKPLAQIQGLRDVLNQIIKDKKSFLVMSEDVKDEALAILKANANPPKTPIAMKDKDGNVSHVLPGRFNCCAVKAPGGIEHMKDLAALVHGEVVTESLGLKLKEIGIQYFGHAKKVVVSEGQTTIYGDSGENLPLVKRVQELRTQVKASSGYDQERLAGRLARLTGGVCIIKVGAATDLELGEIKDRIEDALHATRCAEAEGYVPGGGVTLARCADVIDTLKLEGDEALGARIVKKACQMPLKCIAGNAGENADFVLRTVLKNKKFNHGYNARNGEYGDMVKMGVIDPTQVIHSAVTSAASVASLMLITSTLVAPPKEGK